jgi:hypothetical protein
MRTIAQLFLVFFIMTVGLPAESMGQAPDKDHSVLSDDQIEQRLRFITDQLNAGRPHASYWQLGWTGFYAASTVVQGIRAATENDNDDVVNNLVGAVKSAGGLFDMLLRPLPGRYGADPISAMPSGSREDQLDRLARAEDLLHAGAERAAERTQWQRHLTMLGVNLAAGAVIWGFGDRNDAAVSTIVGTAVGEAAIWSQPARAQTDLKDYQDRFSAPRSRNQARWQILPVAGGAVVCLEF